MPYRISRTIGGSIQKSLVVGCKSLVVWCGPSITLAILIMLCQISARAAGPGTIFPAEPKQGGEILVTYDPQSAGAKLRDEHDIWITGWIHFTNGQPIRTLQKMMKSEKLFQARLLLPKDACYLQVYFVSKTAFDGPVETLVYHNNGSPARGAYGSLIRISEQRDYENYFGKEITLYPDNWEAYRKKWQVMNYFDRELLKRHLPDEMQFIADHGANLEAVGVRALSFGYLLLGKDEDSRRILAEMVRRFPASWETASALDDYQNENVARHFGEPGATQVRVWRISMLGKNPRIDRSDLSYTMAEDKDVPLAPAEQICREWIKDQPDNPEGYATLARIYYARKLRPDEASRLARNALELALPGNLRLYGDVLGKFSEVLIPILYEVLADAELRQHHWSEALQAAKTAQALDRINFTSTQVIEGRIWLGVGQDKRAETAFRDGWRRGSADAKQELLSLYTRRTGSASGFEEFLNPPSKKAEAKSEKVAPDFQVTSLENNPIKSTDLRGKVVVLNFWFTGCAPCRGEIPELNKLVKQYRDQDVVFIAFSTDENEQTVRQFLKDYPFAYQIVCGAGKIAGDFGVQVFPSHIVLDKQGKISASMAGSGSYTALDSVISQLLK